MKARFVWMLLLVFMCLCIGALGEGEVFLQDEETKSPMLEWDVYYPPLIFGDEEEGVAALQTRLTELGYYNGKISGAYREGTQAAVKAFQEDYGLDATGEADSDMQAILFSAQYRALARNDSGEDVKRLQERLKELKYYNGKISGNYLEGTTSAIKTFQERSGLEATGKADIATQEALFDDGAIAKDVPTPAPTPNVTYTEDGAIAAQPQTYTKKLQRGATGKQVKLVQQRLKDLGFFDGPISGNYMNQTQAAVKKFQEYNGIKVDGVTGEKTWNAMFNEDNVVPVNATPRPAPPPTYAITVDVANQVVNVYGLDANNEHTVLVKQMICSTGTKGAPSDVGDWVLNGRKARWCYFPKWGSHAQYWTRINSSIAFHSVIYNTVDTMDLSTKSYRALGSRASHGCIRLLVHDAKWIYDNVEEGTVVTITEDLPYDPELTKSLKPAALDKSRMLPKATPEATPAPTFTGTENYPYSRTLEEGDTGEDVYWLQTALKRLGYYNGTVTGQYYGGTEDAVKAFQGDHGIKKDGKAGKKTWAALQAEVNPTPTPVPTPQVIATPVPEN
ncbi:MAG: peptidoglycan-binding protein [Clostridia bacterium]|nr:peptidoglycan-binding protein [Clostridia bacterium]